MVLNMGKEDLRGLSPGSVQPAGKPRPFLAHPRKSRPPPPRPQPRGSLVPARCRVPAAPQHQANQRVGPLRAKAQARTAFVRG